MSSVPPLLSLCMIARDEESFLPGCLASVARVVDEIVLVDTGSHDATRAIALDAGAHVVDMAWGDDFSAARNAALPHAHGGWVLVLDADERLAPGAGARIRQACASGEADCWMLPVYNADGLDASLDDVVTGSRRRDGITYIPRLLRRTPDLAWNGVIHENPTHWLQRPGRVTRALEAPIVHYGYATEVVAARDKLQRNERLLRRRCASDPRDPDPRIYLAKTLMAAGRGDEAWTVLDEAWSLVRASDPADRGRPTVVMMASDVLRWLLNKPPEAALPYAEEALGWGLDHPNVVFFAGLLLERAAGAIDDHPQARRAATLYRQGIAWSKPPMFAVLPGVKEWLMPLRLGIVLCRLGRHRDAIAPLQRALAAQPEQPSVRVALAEALCGSGDPVRALQVLEPALTDDTDDTADPWWIAAWSMHRAGDSVAAAQLLVRARSLGRTGEAHRARRGLILADELADAVETA